MRKRLPTSLRQGLGGAVSTGTIERAEWACENGIAFSDVTCMVIYVC
jgi:hypothetical protein